MEIKDIIRKKRDGEVLKEEEIAFLMDQYIKDNMKDYQMAAFLMAAFLKGLNEEETYALTKVMLSSGQRLDLTEMEFPKIGKHSTGGVGDKVSIVLGPLVAAAGPVVPMIAGRGLGHTGGTIDKLESIPGFNTGLSITEFRNILWEVGVAITAQTDSIAPLDKRLYSLRDATSTVESPGLIVSSIMSKKLSEGLNGLVLDIKTGGGAFLKTAAEAEALAETMVKIGNAFGVKTIAVLTDMDEPLGKAVGNSLEIRECINMLKGRAEPDLEEVVLYLGGWMLYIAEEMLEESEEMGTFLLKTVSIDEGILQQKIAKLRGLIDSGEAFKKFVEMIEAQGGQQEVVVNPGLLPVASNILPIEAKGDGYIQRVDAEKIGTASMLLGAGRQSMQDSIDHAAGIILNRKSGSEVKKGDIIAVLHYNNDRYIEKAKELVLEAFEIGETPPEKRKMIKRVIL